ncbi:MAG: hypothetical protein AAF583_09720 [Pseudomonadota bacterium]
MMQPLLTAIRTLILRRMVKAMPLRQTRDFPLEPEARAPEPETDPWLLEEAASLQHAFKGYTSSFDRLNDQLSGLRALTSKVAVLAPIETELAPAATTSHVWADDDLFDGYPAPSIPDHVQWAADIDSELFDEDPISHTPVTHADNRIGLQLPIPEHRHPV